MDNPYDSFKITDKKEEKVKLYSIRDISGGETITEKLEGTIFMLEGAEAGKVFRVEVTEMTEEELDRRLNERKINNSN